jgi:phosphate transport system permease protein
MAPMMGIMMAKRHSKTENKPFLSRLRDKTRKRFSDLRSYLHTSLRNLSNMRFSGDLVFKSIVGILALSVVLILGVIFVRFYGYAGLSIQTYGLSFLGATRWQPNPPNVAFGALPPILGTLVTSGIALIIGVPVSWGVALTLSEFTPRKFSYYMSFLVELLAAIPSVIYGLWAIFILIPFLTSTVYPFLQHTLGFLPLFQGVIYGFNVMTAGIVLAIMIIPTVSAITRDALHAVPRSQTEAFIALGATKWETARFSMSYSRSGIIGAIILGMGRAVGETMAVTMVIGSSFNMFSSLFQPATTLAAMVANEFREAYSPPIYVSAIFEIGLLLMALSVGVNLIARLVIWRSNKQFRGAELL